MTDNSTPEREDAHLMEDLTPRPNVELNDLGDMPINDTFVITIVGTEEEGYKMTAVTIQGGYVAAIYEHEDTDVSDMLRVLANRFE